MAEDTISYHVGAPKRSSLRSMLERLLSTTDISWEEKDVTLGASTFTITAPSSVLDVITDKLRPVVRECEETGRLIIE